MALPIVSLLCLDKCEPPPGSQAILHAEDLHEILWLLAHLVIELVAQKRRLAIHLLTRPLDIAKRAMILRAAPERYRDRVHLLQVLLSPYILLRQAHLGH